VYLEAFGEWGRAYCNRLFISFTKEREHWWEGGKKCIGLGNLKRRDHLGEDIHKNLFLY
jgi:hypothetical protein